MIIKLLTEHHLEFLGLKKRLQRLAPVYTCQNVKLLEISCRGSYNIFRELITCDPSIHAMDHPELTVSNVVGLSIGTQMVKRSTVI